MTSRGLIIAVVTGLLMWAGICLFASEALAAPLNPAAVDRAQQFWAPYNGGALPCPGGVTITYVTQDEIVAALSTPEHPAERGHPGFTLRSANDCTMTADVEAATVLTPTEQCGLVAHEIGHNVFGLDHDSDLGSIMNGDVAVVPAACNVPKPVATPKPKSSRKHRRLRHRRSGTLTFTS